MRSFLFWDVTHRRLVVSYRRFGPTYKSHLQGSSRLARNVGIYQSTLRNIPEKQISHLHHGGGRKSKHFMFLLVHYTHLRKWNLNWNFARRQGVALHSKKNKSYIFFLNMHHFWTPIGVTWGAVGGKCSPKIFLTNNSFFFFFFWLLSSRGSNLKKGFRVEERTGSNKSSPSF
jgi:hypothetical protein